LLPFLPLIPWLPSLHWQTPVTGRNSWVSAEPSYELTWVKLVKVMQ
jgi:hypothetical protein